MPKNIRRFMMFEFDPVAFLQAAAPLATAVIFVVMAITYFAGRLGLEGRGQLIFALSLGFFLGGGLIIASTEPVNYADWFFVVLYALIMAVTPSLLYDQGKELMIKAVRSQIGGSSTGRG
jgi:hypothetical protein